MSRSLWYLGVILIIGGLAFSVVPTGSYGTIAGDRPVDVSVASDSEAFVALQGAKNQVSGSGDGSVVAYLTNNLQSSMTIEYEATVRSDTVSVEQSSNTVTVSRGSRHGITVACSSQNSGSGTATLEVTVIEAKTGSATVRDATLETTFEYDCSAGGSGPNAPPAPRGPPGSAIAYIDSDHDYSYDSGEVTVDRNELASFENESAHLVIAADGGRINYRNQEVDISAKTVTIGEATLVSNSAITLSAQSGGLSMRDATIDTKNGEISLTGDTIRVAESTITSNRKISLEAKSGTVGLSRSTVDSENGKIEIKGPSVDTSESTITTNREIKLTAESGSLSLPNGRIESKNGAITIKGRSIDAAKSTISTNREIKLESEGSTLTLSDASVTSKNGAITLKATHIDAESATISTNREIKITSESGPVSLRYASVESKNGEITVKSTANLDADGAVIKTNKAIKLTATGNVTIAGTRISSMNGQATITLNRASATLAVDGAVIADRDNTVVYSPSGVRVIGSPSQGTVRAG
ncbi:hypothetical protein [Halobaculum sp. EA56]|uniref:hypothetical protein n=1 Tax=Halobaculum sp. EA56 TaxID=3421648 RepID=UPI003EC140AB